jgi:hypothetical protein
VGEAASVGCFLSGVGLLVESFLDALSKGLGIVGLEKEGLLI